MAANESESTFGHYLGISERMSHLGPWTRGDVLDLHIFILLVIWMLLDRNQIYLDDYLKRAWSFVRRML